MICFDAHVHIHEISSIDRILESARGNFVRLGPQDASRPTRPEAFLLLLAETGYSEVFALLKEKAGSGRYTTPEGWHVAPTREAESLRVTRDDWAGRLFILAGRQMVTAERIEVLALATPVKIEDGLSLDQTVESVRRDEGLAVLPWGVGKWLGKRGKLVEGFIQRAAPEGLFVGDNGGRPFFWPAPRLFRTAAARGIRLLPGSDPLPLSAEATRVGSYGGWIAGEITDSHPAEDLRRLLTEPSRPIVPFGRRMGGRRFLRVQAALRRLK